MEKIFGFNGKIAFIDLSSSDVQINNLDPKLAEDYIGGVGLSAKLTYDLLSDNDFEILKEDPFSGLNPLIFATGPLTGTATPSSSRYSVTGISPLTGIWGESTSGGFFPVALRRSGYDALVITGQADKPVIINISDAQIKIEEAKDLWGKNTRLTIKSLRDMFNDDKLRVACIGKAGENLVKYAGIINDEGRAAGRCGLGAIMGHKKLKALTIKGDQKIEYANKEEIIKSGKVAIRNMQGTFVRNFIAHYGTLSYMDIGMVFGDIPANYFTNTEFQAEKLTGLALREQYPVLQYSCAGCTIGCGKTTIAKINGKEIEIDGPEYETTAAFGPLCGIFDFKPILEANHISNLEGIDTISGGVSISFLIYLVENKLALDEISSYLTDINIEEIHWGNDEVVLKLLNKIIKREGIGNLLAEGVKRMAAKLHVDPDLAAHVKGLEIPLHDPRAYLGQALTYATACIGASHCKGDFYTIDAQFGSFGKVRKNDRFKINGREQLVIMLQDIRNIFDSAVICSWTYLSVPALARLLKFATGSMILGSQKNLMNVGERATNLKRLISCKLGCRRSDDRLPKIVSTALKSGGTAGITVNLEDNLRVYYEKRGWDWTTGAPKLEKLKQLGILKS